MAKVTFSKLNLQKDLSIDSFDFNGQIIEVKNYLPMEDKLKLINTIVNMSVDENGYYNPVKIYINLIVNVCLTYTNITVTEKQKEDFLKLYDLFVSSGLSGEIIGNHMNPAEYSQIKTWVGEIIHSIYEYRNSVYGVLDSMSTDYSNLNLDVNNLINQIKDNKDLETVREVLNRLG